jgi:GNAT superfamily N-acetyltransferase
MPSTTSHVEIALLPPDAASDRELVAALTDLVNRVYTVAEAGLWVEGATRTTASEIVDMITDGQLAVARLDGAIVGAIRVLQLDSGAGELGLLVADPGHRSEGIGRALVRFAEELSRGRGSDEMQLEVLTPREWTHPTKAFLHDWYTRIGYEPVESGTIDESYPHLAPLLATPCDFVIYRKVLRAA